MKTAGVVSEANIVATAVFDSMIHADIETSRAEIAVAVAAAVDAEEVVEIVLEVGAQQEL